MEKTIERVNMESEALSLAAQYYEHFKEAISVCNDKQLAVIIQAFKMQFEIINRK